MDANDVYEYSDELNEGRSRIRGGCTSGRIINLCIAFDFFLVLITALIVSGSLGAVNLSLQRSYKDHPKDTTPINHEVCILYSTCDTSDVNDGPCDFHYNTSGVCKFVEVAFGFIGLVALIYIIISIVRAVLTTNIWFTVIVDLVVILFSVVVAFSTGVIISIGLSLTCTSVISRYSKAKVQSCDQRIPFLRPESDPATPAPGDGYGFYHTVNVAQSCAWLCFAFLAVLLIMTIVRIIIFVKRRRGSGGENIDDITDVLSREHNDDEEEQAKPI